MPYDFDLDDYVKLQQLDKQSQGMITMLTHYWLERLEDYLQLFPFH
jgi:hypothetical protein